MSDTTSTKDLYMTINYTMTAPDGTVLGASRYNGPFTFKIGGGDAMPGLESRLAGANAGDSLRFDVPAEEAYGERDEQLVRTLPKSLLRLEREPEPGMRMNVNGTIMTITEVTEADVVMDGNHPLAGVPLHFDAEVTAVSDQAPEDHHDCTCGGTCECDH